MEVLCFGYWIPFCHLPPVAREPIEFPFYISGSAKAQALQDEVDKMLQKGALEFVYQPGPGFCSCLFLLQKMIGGMVTYDQLVESKRVCHPRQVHLGDCFIGLGVDPNRGLHVLDGPQGC